MPSWLVALERRGVGIDEGTAVVVQGQSFEVMGKSSVVVIEPGTRK